MTPVMYYSNQSGPKLVATLPEDQTEMPDTAHVIDVPAYAALALKAKGPDVSWPEYAADLAQQAPYFGWWTVTELPDGMTLRDGLIWLQSQGLIGDQPD